MTVGEALRAVQDGQWLRPSGWVTSGEALRVEDGRLLRVPDRRGGRRWTPTALDLVDEWEIVSPDEVLREVES